MMKNIQGKTTPLAIDYNLAKRCYTIYWGERVLREFDTLADASNIYNQLLREEF